MCAQPTKARLCLYVCMQAAIGTHARLGWVSHCFGQAKSFFLCLVCVPSPPCRWRGLAGGRWAVDRGRAPPAGRHAVVVVVVVAVVVVVLWTIR